MRQIQPIEHRGRVVAFVAGDRAIVSDELGTDAHRLVQAKCLYALEIQASERAGPYTDAAATRYAEATRAGVGGCLPSQSR
jgi:hypothetical protein